MATKIDLAVEWAVSIAKDDSHGYDQGANRWIQDYDCSALVIQAYEQAGVPVRTKGAISTHNMFGVFTACGFENVTASVDLTTGRGIQRGDVLLNVEHHTAIAVDENTIVNASQNENKGTTGGAVGDQTGKEIYIREYSNYYTGGWDYVLRYPGGSDGGGGMTANWVEREVPNIGKSLATKAYMAYQTYTNKSAGGYGYLWGENSKTADGGLRMYKNFLCMAFGSYYGPDGTFFKIEFDDGKVIYAVKGDEKKDSETDSAHMYHDYPFDRNVTEFIVDGSVVTSNDSFTAALDKQGINRSARVTRIWTSDTEPTYSSSGGTTEKEYHFADTNEKIPLHPTIFRQAPLTCKGTLKITAADINISAHVDKITWTNTLGTLATLFHFSVTKPNGMGYMNMYIPIKGDIIRYTGGSNEDFRGIVISVDDGDNYENKYIAADVGWYLNKTTDTYQFTAMRADECLKKICTDLYIPIVSMPELTTPISQIYIDKPISDVIGDILDQCEGRYNYDFVPEGIRIYKCADMVVAPRFRFSTNTAYKNSMQFMGGTAHKISIEDLKNSVKVITDTDVMTVLKSEDSIAKYGFLQEVVTMKEGENAEAIAADTLKELNRETETYSGEIIEEMDSYTRAGSVVMKNGAVYLIKSTQHSIENSIHHNKIELERLIV